MGLAISSHKQSITTLTTGLMEKNNLGVADVIKSTAVDIFKLLWRASSLDAGKTRKEIR